MRFAVFGTGAVGGYFGGRLAEAGHDVSFVARGAMLDALRTDGLRASSTEGDFHLPDVNASDSPAQIGSVDAVILGTKAWQVEEAAHAMKPLMGDDTFVIPLQNGVEASARLSGVLGARHVLLGSCRIICFVEAPGRLKHLGVRPVLVTGEHPPNSDASERVQRLATAFEPVKGVVLETPPDMHVALWTKFMLLAPLSGVSAVAGTKVGEVRSNPETRARLVGMLREIVAVGRAWGVDLPDALVEERLAFLDQLPADGSASMARDIADGKPSELDDQVGAIVRLGEAKGVPTPISAGVYDDLIERERAARAAAR